MRTFRSVFSLSVSVSLLTLVAGCDKPTTGGGDANAAASATPESTASAATPAAASASGASDADGAAPSKPGKTVETPAGSATEVGKEVHLAGKPIYPPADCPAGGKDGCAKVKALKDMESAKILRHFDGPGGQKSILLIQVSPGGNACNGGPLFFVRVAKDAAPQYSDVFDHCGGPDPMVGAMPDKILINVPAHPPNKGTGTIAAKNMEYDIMTGALTTAAPQAAKKKR
jgi:hypothetical protein